VHLGAELARIVAHTGYEGHHVPQEKHFQV
jgi:hypothetical protein